VGTVGRFTETGRYLIVTAYRVTERERRYEEEVWGFVILENVAIGMCDRCGNRYYSADTLKRVQAIAAGEIRPKRTERVPVAHAR